MEVPLDGSELNKANAWRESISNKKYADLLKMLNYRTPFRDFLCALSEVWNTPPEDWEPKNPADPSGSREWNWKKEVFAKYIQPNFITRVVYKSLEDRIRDYGEEGYPYSFNARVKDDLVYINTLFQTWNGYMNTHNNSLGLLNPKGPWSSSFQVIKDYFMTLLVNDCLNNKRASYKNLLDGNLIYKLKYTTNSNILIVDIKYIYPIYPRDFKYAYKHRDNYYSVCKHGSLYQYLNLEMEIFLQDRGYESGSLKIKNKGKNNNFTPTYVFIPYREVGKEWSEKKGKILGSIISKMKSYGHQHIDVLKITNETNYLQKKLDLDYFGDLQGYKIKTLEEIGIEGYKVKSTPVLLLNWIKNPMEVK